MQPYERKRLEFVPRISTSKLFGKKLNFLHGLSVRRNVSADSSILNSWGTWNWTKILRAHRDSFVVVDMNSLPQLAWCSKKSRPVTYLGSACYRLDYLEVDPNLQSRGFGTLGIGLVCWRAKELKAAKVVLNATPNALAFYTRLGATQNNETGLSPPTGLVPFTIQSTLLEDLAGAIDALF